MNSFFFYIFIKGKDFIELMKCFFIDDILELWNYVVIFIGGYKSS